MSATTYTAVVGPRDGDWYPVEVPSVPGVFTQGRNLVEVEEMAREAVALALELPTSEVAIRTEWREPFFSRVSRPARPTRSKTYEEAKEAVWREQHEKLRALLEERRLDAQEPGSDS
jgi:predicted RNase H-like HicB family nuclease